MDSVRLKFSRPRSLGLILLMGLGSVILSSCQMGYLIRNGWGQMSLLAQRQSLEKAAIDPEITTEEKRKIQLAIEVREFAKGKLGLKVDQIYTSYVKLDRPYVTWALSAAPRWKLESYRWSFPIVGRMPYKGFFTEAEALAEEKEMPDDLDTYVRGVSAYSTLGWFKDPLLSSMMRYKDHDLVDTLIHELVHATLYIKNHADFNERFAVFLGHKGREMFYLAREGPDSPTLKVVQEENEDEKLFSEFISRELETLDQWYVSQSRLEKNEKLRQIKINEIKIRFSRDVEPKMKTKTWSRFPEMKLNNANLTVYKTYLKNLDVFQAAYERAGSDFMSFLVLCQGLEDHPDPDRGLKEL